MSYQNSSIIVPMERIRQQTNYFAFQQGTKDSAPATLLTGKIKGNSGYYYYRIKWSGWDEEWIAVDDVEMMEHNHVPPGGKQSNTRYKGPSGFKYEQHKFDLNEVFIKIRGITVNEEDSEKK